MKKVIEDVVMRHLKDAIYEHNTAAAKADDIAKEIKALVKMQLSSSQGKDNQMREPPKSSYKIVVQTVIGEISGQGVRVASKCLWDEQNDSYASFTYQNESLFCTGIVFGIYFE